MVCPNCGKTIPGGLFCSECGFKLPAITDAAAPVAQTEAPAAQPAPVEAAPAPLVEPAPVAPAPAVEPAPVENAAPVAAAAPVTSPAPAVEPAPAANPAPVVEAPAVATPAPSATAAPVAPTAPAAAETKPKKKKSAKPFIIIGAVVLGIILLAGAGVGVFFYLLNSKYNEGMKAIENEEYKEAYDTFIELQTFKDSEYWADYAKIELEYEKFDGLVEANDFDGIIKLLEERADFYGKDSKGKDAKALLEEYKIVKSAFEAKDSGDYYTASEQFDSLVLLSDQFGYEANLCLAHYNVENSEWMDAIVNLYGIQIGDLELDYLSNPTDNDQKCISNTYFVYGDYPEDPQAIEDIMNPEGDEATELSDTAIMGLWYNYAYSKWMNYEFEEAIEVFSRIQDFPEAAYMLSVAQNDLDEYTAKYNEADKYFNDGEYYKAKKIFDSIPFIKDSSDRALECKQPMPDTDDYRVDDGSIELNIYAPDNGYAVFIKLYDSDDDAVAQVFIEAGDSTTLYVAADTYTIKVAYGKEWYGSIDLFGEKGSYSQLFNGDDPEFTFRNGYYYDLELYSSTDGNVGSNSLPGGADSM